MRERNSKNDNDRDKKREGKIEQPDTQAVSKQYTCRYMIRYQSNNFR